MRIHANLFGPRDGVLDGDCLIRRANQQLMWKVEALIVSCVRNDLGISMEQLSRLLEFFHLFWLI